MSICDRRSLTGLHGHETTVRIEGMKETPQSTAKSIQMMIATNTCGGFSGAVELSYCDRLGCEISAGVPGSKCARA